MQEDFWNPTTRQRAIERHRVINLIEVMTSQLPPELDKGPGEMLRTLRQAVISGRSYKALGWADLRTKRAKAS